MADYAQLAQQLRRVHARRSERAEQTNPDALAAGGIALDDVLQRLHADELQPLLSNLTQQTKGLVEKARVEWKAEGQGFGIAPEDRFYPADPFVRNLCRFFDSMTSPSLDIENMPQAIVEVLAGLAPVGGVLQEGELETRLGGSALDLLCQVRQVDSNQEIAPRQSIQHLSMHALNRVARSRDDNTYVDRMPALKKIAEQLGTPDILKSFHMASVQHLFPSTQALYDQLCDLGLPRSTLSVGGKDYSSHPDAVSNMQATGLDVHWLAVPKPFSAGASSEKKILEMAKSQLKRMFKGTNPKTSTKRFMLLDDGGKLIAALHKYYPKYAPLCVAIEQTDRGIQLIDDMKARGEKLLCPVVNMARSAAKKETEGPIIGESVAFHIDHELARSGVKVTPKIACIVGYGAVGSATAEALQRRGYQVVITDTDPQKMAQAEADGFATKPRKEAFADGHLFIGATGRTVIIPDEYDLLPDGAVMANAASGNHEFGLHDNGEAKWVDSSIRTDDDGKMHSSFHGQDILVGDPGEGAPALNRVIRSATGKEVLALRAGFVVNMSVGLPPEYCQLTLGLLLASCLVAAKATEPGLVELPAKVQDVVVEATHDHLASVGRSLEIPDFRQLAPWVQ